jgi:hypothetical protein
MVLDFGGIAGHPSRDGDPVRQPSEIRVLACSGVDGVDIAVAGGCRTSRTESTFVSHARIGRLGAARTPG